MIDELVRPLRGNPRGEHAQELGRFLVAIGGGYGQSKQYLFVSHGEDF